MLSTPSTDIKYKTVHICTLNQSTPWHGVAARAMPATQEQVFQLLGRARYGDILPVGGGNVLLIRGKTEELFWGVYE
jgi:hypothetical protein